LFKTNVTISNGADSTSTLALDSGLTTGQVSQFTLQDRGTGEFTIEKLSTNDIGFYDHAGNPRQAFWNGSTLDNFYKCPTGCTLHMQVNAADVLTVSGSAITASQPISGAISNLSGGAIGSIPYQSAATTKTMLAGNTAPTDQVVTSTGTGSAAQAPTLKNAPALSAANMTSFPAAATPMIYFGPTTGGHPDDIFRAYDWLGQ
jgi:hypothetical protein